MNQKFPHLFSSFKIKSVELKNRIVFLPHNTAFDSMDCVPTDQHIHYFSERAKGGVGLIIMEAGAIHPTGKMSPKFVEAYDEKVVPGYQKVTNEVHKYGAKIFAQVTHGGHTTLTHPPQLLWAPTQMPEPSCSYNTKEMEIEDIQAVIDGFACSASHIKKGGFDGIEIKAATHDGLLRSFISPFFNKRNDEYGGSFENRMRLSLEVINAIRVVVGPDFPFGVRVCLDEFTEWGYSLDYGKEIVKKFTESKKVDYISTDAGTFSSYFMEIPPSVIPLGFAIYMSSATKEVTDLPVIAFGRINDPVQAEDILVNGYADLVGIARELVCDPEFPVKASQGRVDDIRHCIACQDGCCHQVTRDKHIRCIQNPAAGREKKYGIGTLKPPKQKKRVMIIGGGPAGLKVAEIAAERGHSVSIYEKENRLGGQVLLASKLPHREEIEEVVRYLIFRIKDLGVDIHLKDEIDSKSIKKLKPEVVVVAIGSYPVIPQFPNNHNIKTLSVRDVLTEKNKLTGKVMVVDKDRHWQGIGIAEYLLDRGLKVEIVSPSLFIGEYLEGTNIVTTYQRLFEKGIIFTPHTDLRNIINENIVTYNIYSMKEFVHSDITSVVFVGINRSSNSLYLSLKNQVKELYAVGDCVSPRKIEQVIYEANEIGRLI